MNKTFVFATFLFLAVATPGMPQDKAKEIKPTSLPEGRFPRLGVAYKMVPDGAVIIDVQKDSPASVAGLEKGDRIIRVDGFTIGLIDGNWFTLPSEIRRAKGTCLLQVHDKRTNKVIEMKVQFGEK